MMRTGRTDLYKDALLLAGMQFLNWSICTLSWRAVAQANVMAAIITDTTLGTLNFYILRKIARAEDTGTVAWLGYTAGGVLGTITGIWLSIWWFGK